MAVETVVVLGAIMVGIGATLVADVWALVLKRAFDISSLSYCLVGRWLLHMPEGRFTHASIAAAERKPFECTMGWIAHYAIGIVFGLALIFFVSGSWLAQPTLVPALLFGIGTVAFPFLVMQPSFGFGIAASRTPNPRQARLKSFVTHTVFGLGLYVSAVVASYVLRVHV